MSRLWLVMGWWGSRRTHLCRLPDGDLLSFSYPPRNPGGDRRLVVAAAAQAAPSTIVPHARKLAISSGAPSAVPALRCVFVHGIGVKGSSEPSSTPSPSGYWGAALEASCVTVGVVFGARVVPRLSSHHAIWWAGWHRRATRSRTCTWTRQRKAGTTHRSPPHSATGYAGMRVAHTRAAFLLTLSLPPSGNQRGQLDHGHTCGGSRLWQPHRGQRLAHQ